jgi:hypothetical protein
MYTSIPVSIKDPFFSPLTYCLKGLKISIPVEYYLVLNFWLFKRGDVGRILSITFILGSQYMSKLDVIN